MARKGLSPARVLCSTANRAVETWELVSLSLENPIEVEYRDDLYHASVATLIAALRDLPGSEDSVLLVGHNPTLEEAALALAAAGHSDSMEQLGRKYPTGALAILEFPVDTWSQVKEGTGFLRDFVRPRTLKA